MKLTINSDGILDIETSSIYLHGGLPVVNSCVLENIKTETVLKEPDHQICKYRSLTLGEGIFTLESRFDKPLNQVCLRYWIEDLDPSFVLDSFGLQFQAIDNLRSYLRNGYYSWDGSAYVDVEALTDFEEHEPRPEISYAVTQLLPHQGRKCVILGFDRHDRFQQVFKFDSLQCPPALLIQTLWDQKDRNHLPRCESEQLLIFEADKAEEGLREWASLVAQASPIPPRDCIEPITGWCSWYNLYSYISEEIILKYLAHTREVSDRENLPMSIFQIDVGFNPEVGDWLDIKPQFPRGMKPIMHDIRKAGFIPGLWIGPFMVGNRSRLYREHPDWVVLDRNTDKPLVQWRFVGEERWHSLSEEYYILDATHPDAFEYLRQVFRIWRQEWGCEYFKTDFMHFGSEHGPDRAVWHTPGLTRIEIWRKVAEMIREEIGDAIWMGCGCPLWASVGLVDGIRIGHDVGVDWRGRLSAQSLIGDLATRNFANHILWKEDPDCILLRDDHHNLTDQEVRSLAIYAGMSGGYLLTSDDLLELPEERMRLWKFILEMDASPCNYPFLGDSPVIYDQVQSGYPVSSTSHEPRLIDPVVVQVRPKINVKSEISTVFIFNTGEYPVQRSYRLDSLGLKSPLYVSDWIHEQTWPESVDRLSVTIAPHDGVLLLLSDRPFDK